MPFLLLSMFGHCKNLNVVMSVNINESNLGRKVIIISRYVSLVFCSDREEIRAIYSCKSDLLVEQFGFIGKCEMGVRMLLCQSCPQVVSR